MAARRGDVVRVELRPDGGTRAAVPHVVVPTEIGDVVDAGGDAGDAFVVERAPLPAVGDGVGEGADFVGMQALQVLALAEEHSHVRAEEFVGGADEEIAIEGGDVDEAVRAVVDGVDVGERSSSVSEANDCLSRD